ncbi:MAG: M18 family aminopeptidase [Ruminococcus sp.]|nr:M18 family aminopeptidase [Ruminococcus sp.]
MQETVRELFSFIEESPSVFHVVENMRRELLGRGYGQLLESEPWELKAGGKYFVIRNGSSLISFRIPREDYKGFQIMASHCDSPTFKIKENPQMEAEGVYVRLNVEKYGGALLAPWFDRPLSVAGRVLVRKNVAEEKGRIVSKLVDIDRDLLLIPSLAIHMNREANDGYKYNVQKDLIPLYGMDLDKETFMEQISGAAGVCAKDVVGYDLFLYNRVKGSVWGAKEEFISSGKLDDLQCVFASLKGFLQSEERVGESVPVHCVFDNEEVGSSTRQGAASTFLQDTLVRVNEAMGRSSGDYRRSLSQSFMLSADNAHAVHPNYPDKACPTNRPKMNGGIVIKYNAEQRYTTDGVAAALFKDLCGRANVPWQTFHNRSDERGGSTLGNLSGNQVAVKCVDIGLAQLAMHSPYETAGAADTDYLVRAAKAFYEMSVDEPEYGVVECSSSFNSRITAK